MAKRTTKIVVSVYAEKRAKQIFMAFYKITCSVLDSKACALYHIEEMKKETKDDELPFWDEVKQLILSGIKMD